MGHLRSALSGPHFQQQLQEAGHQVPIIFITGDGDTPMTVEAMMFGALEFLAKRFDVQSLLDAVEQTFAGKSVRHK